MTAPSAMPVWRRPFLNVALAAFALGPQGSPQTGLEPVVEGLGTFDCDKAPFRPPAS